MTPPADILVLGLGSSGVAVARYAASRPDAFARVTAIDAADTPALRTVADGLARLGVEVELGTTSVERRFETCVASPGIPPHAPIMQWAREASGRIVSEVQFAFEQEARVWVGVTGTNGKTTTTALIAHLLNCAGMPARAVGNIGVPTIEAIKEDGDEILVAEVSSFQLALTTTFRPRVAVMLNLTPDHIDWHGSMERYAEDKARIFANLGAGDVAVIDVDDPGSTPYAGRVGKQGATVVPVSRERVPAGGAGLREGVLCFDTLSGLIDLLAAEELLIRGPHNTSNALAAAAAAHALGARVDAIATGLRTFSPIEHRLEPVGVVAGAEWFNDSKATNPDAVSKAIASFGDRPLVLLLGGRNKGSDFGPLALEAAERARAVVVFGEACEELRAAFVASGMEVVSAQSLEQAVHAAAAISQPGDAVVLSPACASFDEFTDYGHRGRVFKELVARLEEGDRS